MIKRILSLAAIAAAASLAAFSQGTIDSKVVVKRDYAGEISGVHKSKLSSKISDTLFNFNLKLDYPTFYRPYKDLYEFSPQGTAGVPIFGKPLYPVLAAKLSAAYPLTSAADIYLSPRLGNRFSLLLYYNHSSFWDYLPVMTLKKDGVSAASGRHNLGDRMINDAGLGFAYDWSKGRFAACVDVSNNFYSFCGADFSGFPLMAGGRRFDHGEMRKSASHDFNRLNAGFSVKSSDADPYSLYYELDAKYRYIDNRDRMLQRSCDIALPDINAIKLKEHGVDVKLSLGAVIAKKHKIFVTLKNSSNLFHSIYDGNPLVTTGLWEVEPEYARTEGRWGMNLGLKISSAYGSDDNYRLTSPAFIYPDVTVNFEAARNALWLYVKVYGENRVYSQYYLASINPWFDDKVRNVASSVPFACELGLKGTVADKFSYHLFGRYEIADSMLSFKADDVYQIPYLRDNKIVTAGIDLKWNSRNFYASADFKYRRYSDGDAALMSPAFESGAVAEYNYMKRIFLRADCHYRSSVTGMYASSGFPSYGGFYKVPGFVDLGVRISYVLNTKVSLFLEGGNLLNQKIQYFLNYAEPGTTVEIGLYLTL